MNCYICELPLDAGARFCGNCGAPVRAPGAQQAAPQSHPQHIQSPQATPSTHRAPQKSRDRTWAGVIALLSSIVALIGISWAVCGVAASFSAILFGIVGLKSKRRWLALLGIALGLLLLCISTFRLVAPLFMELGPSGDYAPQVAP